MMFCGIQAQTMTSDYDNMLSSGGHSLSFNISGPNPIENISYANNIGTFAAGYSGECAVDRWYANNVNFSFDIMASPFISFQIMAVVPASFGPSTIRYDFFCTDGNIHSMTATLPSFNGTWLTYDVALLPSITTFENTNSVTVQGLEQIYIGLGYNGNVTPLDSLEVQIKRWAVGDSANPCKIKTPTFNTIGLINPIPFNQNTPTTIDLSGISDGNNNTKGTLKITAVSSDSNVIATPIIIFPHGSDTTTALVEILGAQPPLAGTATITVTISDTAFCNFSLSRTSPMITVNNEVLTFSLPTPTVGAYNNEGLDSVSILSIGNGSGNYQGMTMSAIVTSGGALLSSYSNLITIDSVSQVSYFYFTPAGGLGKVTAQVTLVSKFTGNKTQKNITINISKGSATTITEEGQLNVYPNPVKELLNVVLPDGTVKIDILSLDGKIVKSIDVHGQTGTIVINVSELAQGTYILTNGIETVKFSK